MKNIEIYLPEYIRQHYILSFMYGSYVYGTNTDKSDEDIIVIVDDKIELENSVNGIKEIFVTDGINEYDFQMYSETITEEQFEMVDKYWGISSIKSRSQIIDFLSEKQISN